MLQIAIWIARNMHYRPHYERHVRGTLTRSYASSFAMGQLISLTTIIVQPEEPRTCLRQLLIMVRPPRQFSLVILTSRFEVTRGLFWDSPCNSEPRSEDEGDT
ncbi:hypothetical protein AVEN_115236-1 [Araneus ventricosus]|uniref:Uncharacterized protein n=1 Tax=Araneus ventricosus TaxID=182803 RepID=A0A4Y1ZZL4_ARAVE|nr:hypothetical protein AVEN_115236-1 [Araneus ventricosus]